MQRYDVVVVGGGVMGTATTEALARRGRRVALLDRFEPGHGRGSSHGTSRVFRLGYEDAEYVALGRRALELWRDLEARSGATLLELTGVVDHGPTSAIEPLAHALAACGVAHTPLDPAEAAARWPGLVFDEAVVHHADGGRVRAQLAVDVLTQLARSAGAVTRFGAQVTSIEDTGDGVTVRTAGGDALTADAVVVTAGAWARKVVGHLADLPPLQVSAEQPVVLPARTRPAAQWLPVAHRGPADTYLLGVPGEGVKVAEHYRDEWLDPDDRPFGVDEDALARIIAYVEEWLPGLEPRAVSVARCLYTTTPDRDFVLDRTGRVVVGAGFSGHGFKFAPAIGEVLADLAEGAEQPVERFRSRAGSRTATTSFK